MFISCKHEMLKENIKDLMRAYSPRSLVFSLFKVSLVKVLQCVKKYVPIEIVNFSYFRHLASSTIIQRENLIIQV